jgi:hypothetical protein
MEQHPVEDRALRMTRTIDSRHIGKADSRSVPGAPKGRIGSWAKNRSTTGYTQVSHRRKPVEGNPPPQKKGRTPLPRHPPFAYGRGSGNSCERARWNQTWFMRAPNNRGYPWRPSGEHGGSWISELTRVVPEKPGNGFGVCQVNNAKQEHLEHKNILSILSSHTTCSRCPTCSKFYRFIHF